MLEMKLYLLNPSPSHVLKKVFLHFNTCTFFARFVPNCPRRRCTGFSNLTCTDRQNRVNSGGTYFAMSTFPMSTETQKYLKFGGAVAVIVVSLGFLAYTGVQESKSYYVTIKELRGMGDSAYTRHLRVAGNVQPGSIKRSGTSVNFVLIENDHLLPVIYSGTEAPPDTFKDDSQALADGNFGRDGVFHAKQLQAKCASKYAPQQAGATASGPAGMSN